VLGTTLVMRGFWQALHGPEGGRRQAAGLFFLGLVVGLLAKGPLVLVLAGLPLGLWTLWTWQWGAVWRQLPWWRGSVLVTLLVAPWYVLAERHTPGFLNYFLVGEHWHRFVTPGWSGDRYGGAHSAPWGSIWAYAWLATFPWSLLLPLAWWRWRKAKADALATALPESAALAPLKHRPLQHYLLLWSLAPAVFFTFAGNILWTYVLPAIPPLALLGAAWLSRCYDDERVNQWLARGVAASALLLAGLVLTLNLKSFEDFQTTKLLVADYKTLNTRGRALLFYPARPYSASFYTQGQAQALTQVSEVRDRMAGPQTFLAVKVNAEASLPADLRAQLHFLTRRGDYKLFEMGTHYPLFSHE
jgi:4-amino-4-deoxy-L-arabinose transferase-like glycosyltransferase